MREEHSAWRHVAAGVVAALIGYFGGGIALDLSEVIARPAGGVSVIPYTVGALFGLLIVWMSLPIIGGLFVTALLADRALAASRQHSRPAYALAGAIIGAGIGAVVAGYLFKIPLRGAFCGPPVGALAGWAFWAMTRPRP